MHIIMHRIAWLPKHRRALAPATLIIWIWLTACVPPTALANDAADDVPGKATYRYYCYQCHGYSGDANTLATSYLDPAPRDFTAHTDETLPTKRMIDAIRNGRDGTAMVQFSTVLTDEQISDVVDYIRNSFMTGEPLIEKYHSVENGWVNHERYASAFPYIQGTIAIDVPWEELDADQQRGKQLYESSCVSCHDQANSGSGETVWELRAVSYPRKHFSHKADPPDFVSGASPYAMHDIPTTLDNMSQQQSRGMRLYQDNCAFCHAADGTGRNWIGSFLEPRPRDFTAADFTLLTTPLALRELIKGGIPASSMPAWRAVLADRQIDDIIAYMQAAFAAQ
jgi:cytochrome c oxidase cbb3-type subunit 3